MCEVQNCPNKVLAKSLCNRHYLQKSKKGYITPLEDESRDFIDCGNYAKIPLGAKAKQGYALVDISDAYLSQHYWHKHHTGYAQALVKGKLVRLHRLIMTPGADEVVDHINHDILDNRRKNLRTCSVTENRRNSNKSKANTTGYKGVSIFKGKYVAMIGHMGKKIFLGRYKTAQEAALAYDTMAMKLHGSFYKGNIKEI